MRKATDKEAEILIRSFENGDVIVDHDGRGKGKVISIEHGVCVIEFENGEIDQCENHYFYTTIVGVKVGVKVIEFQIVSDFLCFMIKEAENTWPVIYQSLKDSFGQKFIVEDENCAALDLALAAIAKSLGAVKNLFPKDQAERIEKWIPAMMDNKIWEWSDYVIEEINKYKKYEKEIERTGREEDCLYAIPSRLLHRWLGENLKNFVFADGIINPILITAIGYELALFTSSWNWKTLKKNCEIVDYGISVDEFEDMLDTRSH